MSALDTLLAHKLFQALGWALVHFIWQGALVALTYAGAELWLRRASAQARYAAGCVGLLLMLACPVGTLLWCNATQPLSAHVQATSVLGSTSATALRVSTSNVTVRDGALVQADDFLDDTLDAPAPFRLWLAERFPSALPWLVLAWLAGACVLSLRLAGGWLLARRLRREPAPLASRAWQETAARLARRLRVSRPFRLCESALIEVPAVIDVLRPIILLPACALTGLSAPQLEALIAHELAHVGRHDYLVNLLQTCIETLLFYHPAVWWLSRRVRTEREHCCDDAAVAATGDVLVYAHALTALEQLRRRPVHRFAIAANGGSLMQRIQRLLQPHRNAPRRAPASAGLLLMLIALLSILAGAQGLASLRRYDAPEASAPQRPVLVPAQRKVAVTFVSMPATWIYYDPRAERELRKLIASLNAHNIPATGFVNESSLYHEGQLDEQRVALLRLWLDAGFDLGAQPNPHASLYDTPLADFEQDVLRGEEITGQLLKERGRSLRYFSYPFLNTGPDAATKEAAEKFLAARHYRIHQVTIDNMDWLFGKVYMDALRRGDEATMQRVADEYVPYMERMFEFYEQLSRDTLGHEPPQVLLLMASALNADKMDDLVAMLQRRGYQFVTLDEAQQDKAYSLPDTYTGPMGISWLQRWAMAKGASFRKEPYLPPYMQQYDFRQSGSDFKTNLK